MPRNLLEWRIDPRSEARIQQASYDLEVVVFCNAGQLSSLAVASLLDLGLHRATDITGGFRAWRAAGLPVTAPSETTFSQPGASR
ncbi:MAG: Rhodanese domain protein [Mycobacterium sp.]|jgi:rhodanese-related sulfurtransferase|nr:Rhodanese domain protein [Mycobacterium sp.]